MEILVILGFVVFAVLSVIGTISILKQINEVDRLFEQRISKLEQEKEELEKERLQYLAGIKTNKEAPQVPVKLGPDLIGELLAESEVELLKELEEKPKKK